MFCSDSDEKVREECYRRVLPEGSIASSIKIDVQGRRTCSSLADKNKTVLFIKHSGEVVKREKSGVEDGCQAAKKS